MTKEQAQQIYLLVEKVISQVKKSSHMERFILKSEEDEIYIQVLDLLKEKQKKVEIFLKKS